MLETLQNDSFNHFNHESPLWFTTEMRDLYSHESHPDLYGEFDTHRAGTYQGVFRTDNDKCLGVFKDGSYTLVNNYQFYRGIEEQLINFFDPSVLDLCKIEDTSSWGGAVCIRQYLFPNLEREIVSDRHSTSLTFRVIGWNCFDGSSKCRLIFGNIDSFCSNGLISGDYDQSSKKRTSGFDLTNFVGQLEKGILKYENDVSRYQTYAETKVLTPYVSEFFETLSGMSERNAKRLQDQYLEEASIRGNNLWAVVSTLTNYASHTDGRFPVRNTGNDHHGVTSYNRQSQVNKWLNSPQFVRLQNHSMAA